MTAAIRAQGLRKGYGPTQALAGLDLEVPAGTVLGLLGRNGAGKSTTVRILTTLLRPDGGWATVAGADVVRAPDVVRSRIGLAGQYSSVDERLTGRENLVMVGRLYHLSRPTARRRADELLERFSLTGPADRLARTYSGGMRRRLDLAASLMNQAPVLFLDEPTTGLDPGSRVGLWSVVEELVADGTTVLLTTQYLEEVDRLAHRIAVLDRGRVVAEGTGDELKRGLRADVVAVAPRDRADLADVATMLTGIGTPTIDATAAEVTVPTSDGVEALAIVAGRLHDGGVGVLSVGLRSPSLDEVFLALTEDAHAAPSSPGSTSRWPRGLTRAARTRAGASR